MDIRFVFLFSLIPWCCRSFYFNLFCKGSSSKEALFNNSNNVRSNIGSLVTKRENRPFVFLLVVSGIFGLGAFNFSFYPIESI